MIVLGLLAGLTAGIVLGCAQLVRRTSTAYERLERATGVPDAVLLSTGGPDQVEKLVRIPQVRSSLVTATGIAQAGTDARRFLGVLGLPGSTPPGLFTPIIVAGRAADPRAPNEVVISEHASDVTGFHVGSTVDLAFLTSKEFTQFDTGFGEPDGPKVKMRVVGIARTAIDQGVNAIEAYSTPAFAKLLGPDADSFPTVMVRLRDGARSLPAFERAVRKIADATAPVKGGEEFAGIEVQVPSRQRPVLAVTARVLVIGLLAFAVVAGIAGLLGVGLALRRHFQATVEPDLAALGAIGITARETRAARLISALPFVATGAVVAALVGVGLGVMDPIGSLARQEPHPGWHVNVAIVALGAVVVTLLLVLIALVAGPIRLRARASAPLRASGTAARLASAGAPPPSVIGSQMALQAGRGRTAVPARSTLVGTTLGVLGLVGVIVFASSLDRLVDTPSRWGWVTDALVQDASQDVRDRLVRSPSITAVSRYDEVNVDVEGRDATAEAFTHEKGSVGWTVLDGRMPAARGEILLGARLGREIDRGVGDAVVLRGKHGATVRFRVVGIGVGPNLTNQQFAGGVVIAHRDVPRVGQTQPFVGASVKFRHGVDADKVATRLGRDYEVDRPTRPPDVDNLAQLGALPALLAAFLALVGLAVLAHLLISTTRRRRRDLDTLRALGFVPRQARAVVMTVALVTMGVGLVIGVPLGIAVGRLGWQFTARSVYVAGDPKVSVVAIVGFVLAALVAAVVAAAWPAWRVARGPAASGLRDE